MPKCRIHPGYTWSRDDLRGEMFPCAACEREQEAENEPEEEEADEDDDDVDICGFCGEPGADKIPHSILWPNERSAGTPLVHDACEREECSRAHADLTDEERKYFLLRLRGRAGGRRR